MEVPDRNIKEIINRLYSNKLLGVDELMKIERWLINNQYHEESEAWLKANWESSVNASTSLSFDEIRQRIRQNHEKLRKQKFRDWIHQAQRIAAVLFIPLLIVSSWLIFQRNQDPSQWLALTTKPGERTHVVLPDGSEAWINVDTKLEYPTTFNQKNRQLKLNGEAFFKVAKGKEIPFKVNTKDFEVMAVGTEFNISAYPDDANSSTFLKEGIVKFTHFSNGNAVRTFEMKPGQQVIVNSERDSVSLQNASILHSGNWRNGELYFTNEPMDAVFRKMERWYNIIIHFNPEEFAKETLVVNLKNGESDQRLLEIIDNAIGIQFKKTENEYWITKR
ncbi:MAG: FecR family protein [Mangrovibacterium sp.]